MLSARNAAASHRRAEPPHLSRGETPQPASRTDTQHTTARGCRDARRGSAARPQASPCPVTAAVELVQEHGAAPCCLGNDVTWPGALLLDGEEHLGRKELVLDICGEQERKMKSSPISETIIGAGNKHCPSDTCPSATPHKRRLQRPRMTLAGHTNSEMHLRGTTEEQSLHMEAEHTGGTGGIQ